MYSIFNKLNHNTKIISILLTIFFFFGDGWITISLKDAKEEYLKLTLTIEKLKCWEPCLGYKAISSGILEKLQLLEVSAAEFVA